MDPARIRGNPLRVAIEEENLLTWAKIQFLEPPGGSVWTLPPSGKDMTSEFRSLLIEISENEAKTSLGVPEKVPYIPKFIRVFPIPF